MGTQVLTVDFQDFAPGTEILIALDLDRDPATGGTPFSSQLEEGGAWRRS